MFETLACRLCLATDVRLTAIANTTLQDMYEKLANTALNSLGKPTAACYLCAYQLRKCQDFMKRVARADELLTRMLHAGAKVTPKSIAMIDREAYKLSPNLATAGVKYCDMEYCRPELEIKLEAPYEIEITCDVREQPKENETAPIIKQEPYSSEDQNTITQEEQTVSENNYKKEILISNDCGNNFNNEWILPHRIESHNDAKAKENLNCDSHPDLGVDCDPLEEQDTSHNNRICSVYETQEGSSENNFELPLETHIGEKHSESTVRKYRRSVKSDSKQDSKTNSEEKPYACTICEYRSGKKANLEKHVRTHTGEKPYQCTLCTYRCTQKSGLKLHLRIHTGEKPYKCTVCEYRCTSKSYLNSHIKTHTGEKPYKCHVCEYRCIEKGHLERHLRRHTGEKPYECTVCSRKFARMDLVRVHLTKIHGMPKSDICDKSGGPTPGRNLPAAMK